MNQKLQELNWEEIRYNQTRDAQTRDNNQYFGDIGEASIRDFTGKLKPAILKKDTGANIEKLVEDYFRGGLWNSVRLKKYVVGYKAELESN